MFKEFKEFISKGNAIDLAIGVVMGSAFSAIVNSIVNDIIMPIVGFLTAGVDFTDLKLILKEAVGEAPAVSLNYGSLIQAVINFLVVALCLFYVAKAMNKMKKKKEEKPAEPAPKPDDVVLLEEIRDLLKK